jgi:hypothetical protein
LKKSLGYDIIIIVNEKSKQTFERGMCMLEYGYFGIVYDDEEYYEGDSYYFAGRGRTDSYEEEYDEA